MKHYPLLLYFSSLMSLLGSLQFGYQIGVANTSLPQIEETLNIPTSRGAVAVSTLLVGAFFGALFAGNLANSIGPKKVTILNTLPLAIGSLLCATAPSELHFLAGRFIAGIGTGAASLLVPRYLTEIAPNSIRGLLGTLNQVFINIGIVLSFSAGFPLEADPHKTIDISFRHGTSLVVPWWRIMFASGIVPAAVQAMGMAMCPETPVWLLFAGLHLQASRSYRALQGHSSNGNGNGNGSGSGIGVDDDNDTNDENGNDTDTRSDEEASLLEASTHPPSNRHHRHRQQHQHQQHETSFKTLLEPQYRRIMILAAGLPLLQQFGGINTVILYGTQVFRQAGVASPIIANLLMGIINTMATGIAAALMDHAGRKMLLVISFTGMAAALTVLSFCFILFPDATGTLTSSLAELSILAYIVAFALGCGPVPWVYLPEILPPAIIGQAQALCTALNWGGNLVVGATFPAMLSALGLGQSYLVYAVACSGAAVFCQRLMIETKQKSLAAVHDELMMHVD